jgi:HK97 family phage major capsid protein
MKKIKKPDGSTAEVADDYTLVGDEEFVDEGDGAKTEGDEGDDEEKAMKEDLKNFIKSETAASFEKELENKADALINKFFDGVASQRAKVIAKKQMPIKKSDQEVVRTWLKCLVNRDHQGMMALQKDYMQTGDNEQGGYLVPPQLVAEVNRFVEVYGVARRDMRYMPFSGPGNERQIPALSNSVSVFWVTEGGAKPSTKPTFELVTQTLKKLAAIVPMTEEILEDSAINLISLLGELFGEAVAMEEDRVFFNGSVAAGDPYNGVLRATGVTNVYMGNSDSADDIDADDLNDLIYAVPRAVRDSGKFYLHSTLFQQLQQLRASTTGNYIVQSPVGERPGTIWNRPYELLDILPDSSLATKQSPFMFYANLQKTCVYGDKGGMRVKLLDQAIVQSADESPADLNLATQDMVALRIVKRVGYVPILPAGIAVLNTGA